MRTPQNQNNQAVAQTMFGSISVRDASSRTINIRQTNAHDFDDDLIVVEKTDAKALCDAIMKIAGGE